MPQAKSGGSRSRSGASAKSTSGRSPAKRSTGASSARSTAAKRSTGTKAQSSKSTSGTRSTSRARSASSPRAAGGARSKTSARSTASKSATSAAEAQLEAVAKRLRKLNERIIEAGREAGETTLSSYEKALKTIAGTLERGPGRSDVEWISNLATAQAKFIRDLTASWTSAARKALK
jgi:hypothetical protein